MGPKKEKSGESKKNAPKKDTKGKEKVSEKKTVTKPKTKVQTKAEKKAMPAATVMEVAAEVHLPPPTSPSGDSIVESPGSPASVASERGSKPKGRGRGRGKGTDKPRNRSKEKEEKKAKK